MVDLIIVILLGINILVLTHSHNSLTRQNMLLYEVMKDINDELKEK